MHQTTMRRKRNKKSGEKTLNKYSTRKTFTFDTKRTYTQSQTQYENRSSGKRRSSTSIDIFHQVYKDSESEWELNAIGWTRLFICRSNRTRWGLIASQQFYHKYWSDKEFKTLENEEKTTKDEETRKPKCLFISYFDLIGRNIVTFSNYFMSPLNADMMRLLTPNLCLFLQWLPPLLN